MADEPYEPDWDWIAQYIAPLMGDDEDEGREAAKELGQWGGAGALVLISAARDPRPAVRANVAYGIGWMRDPWEEARDALLALLGDPDLNVRAQACISTMRLRPNVGRPIVRRLADVLRDGVEAGHISAVLSSIEAIRHIGPAAGPTAPALVAFLGRARGRIRDLGVAMAIEALGCVRSCNGPDVEVLRGEIDRHPDKAAWSLRAYGSLAKGASVELRLLLDSANPRVVRAAAATLARMGSDERAAQILVDMAVDGDPSARLFAIGDLGDVRNLPDHLLRRLEAGSGDPETGVAAMAKNLEDNERMGKILEDLDHSSQLASAHFLRGYGPLARASAPRLRAWLVSHDPWLRIGAAAALARIEPGDEAASAMADFLDDPSPEVRKAAALALDEFASPPESAVARLRALPTDPDPDVARAGSFVLGEIAARAGA